MGRNTFDSIGRPLPGRTNIILSRQPANDSNTLIWNNNETSLLWSRSKEDAMYLADILSLAANKKEFFVIGGEQMFANFLDLGNRVHLTEIFAPMPREAGDSYFDQEFDGRKWRTLEQIEVPAGPDDDYPSRYTLFDRKIKTIRYVELGDYLTSGQEQEQWISEQYKKIHTSLTHGAIREYQHQFRMFNES